MNRNETNNVSSADTYHNRFYCEVIPQDLLLGLNFRSFNFIEEDEAGQEILIPSLKFELGFLFIKFSFMKVTYPG